MNRGAWAAVLAAVPAVILAASYGVLAGEGGRWDLWHAVVHENGRYTLAQTVGYFDHVVREFLLDGMSAWAIAAAFRSGAPAPGPPRWRGPLLAAGFAVVALIALAAWQKVGTAAWWADLSQQRVSDERTGYGAHWHSHLLHLAAMPWLAAGGVQLYRVAAGQGGVRMRDLAGWWAAFLALSALFRTGTEPFTDVRYLGHQAREIVTHASVTLPLAMAALITFDPGARAVPGPRPPAAEARKALALLAAGGGILLAIVWRLRGVDVLAAAQSQRGYAGLMASHYFEHSLDYLLVAWGAVCLGAWWPASRSEPGAR